MLANLTKDCQIVNRHWAHDMGCTPENSAMFGYRVGMYRNRKDLIKLGRLSANNEWARFSKNKYISSYAIQDSIHWIGTGVGLFKYNSNKDSLKYLSEIDSISTEKVDYIAKSDNGSVWFVIDGSSLFYFNKGNWINYSSSNSDLPEGKITKIATNNDDLLVIIDNRLMKFDGENWFCYPKLRDSFGETFRVNDIIVNTDIIWLHTTESIAAYHNWKWQE